MKKKIKQKEYATPEMVLNKLKESLEYHYIMSVDYFIEKELKTKKSFSVHDVVTMTCKKLTQEVASR